MAAIPCANRTVCCSGDNEDPLSNFSMEAPDPNRFLSGNPTFIFDPPLGSQWGAQSCSGWCWSSISAEDAYLCALNAQQSCVVDPPDPDPNPDPRTPLPPGGGPNGNSGWQNPDGTPAHLFPNEEQTCAGTCPDGTPTTYTLPAGSIYATTQSLANHKAYGLACKLAATNSLCITSISPLTAGCPGESYLMQLSASGVAVPIVWTLVGGSLPDGLSLTTDGLIIGIVDSNAIGDFTATIRATDANGTIRQKNFVIGVCGCTNASLLTGYSIGVPYSVQLVAVQSVGCGTGAQTFELVGSLPPGLSLNTATGVISGTPTASASGDYTFSIVVVTA